MSISDSHSHAHNTPPCHGLGREEHGESLQSGAGTCHRANGIEVMDWSVLPDAAVIIPASSRRGLSRASQCCKILQRIPIALVYDQAASKSGLTLPVHLSLSLVKSASPFANLSSPFLFLLPVFSLRGPQMIPRNLFLCAPFFFFQKVHQVFVIRATSLRNIQLRRFITQASCLCSDHFDWFTLNSWFQSAFQMCLRRKAKLMLMGSCCGTAVDQRRFGY